MDPDEIAHYEPSGSTLFEPKAVHPRQISYRVNQLLNRELHVHFIPGSSNCDFCVSLTYF